MTEPKAAQERLRALIEQWRAKAAVTDTFHATMGIGWKVCADELEAALTGALPQPPETLYIDQIKSHWFAQGGASQFGDIDGDNADEIVSAILRRVRAVTLPPRSEKEAEENFSRVETPVTTPSARATASKGKGL